MYVMCTYSAFGCVYGLPYVYSAGNIHTNYVVILSSEDEKYQHPKRVKSVTVLGLQHIM